jgi:hypothetical protein
MERSEITTEKYNPYNGFVINEEFLLKRPLSQSNLKQFKKSPRHYIEYLTGERKKSDVFTKGSLIDCLALEPEKFDDYFVLYSDFNKRLKENKSKLDEYVELETKAMEKGLTMVTDEVYKEAKICVEALYDHNEARTLLEAKSNVQMKINWIDKATRLPLIGKIDFESNAWGSHYLVDLKSSDGAEPDVFNRDIFNYGYNIQCAVYLIAYQKKFFKFPEYLNLVVEKKPPYNVTIMYYDGKECEASKDEFYGLLKAFRRCMDEGKWAMGYDFWLFEMNRFFRVNRPGYYKHHGIGTAD